MFRETLGNHGLPAFGGGLGQRVRLLRLPEAEIDEDWLHRDSSDHPARTVPRPELAIKAASCADSVRQGRASLQIETAELKHWPYSSIGSRFRQSSAKKRLQAARSKDRGFEERERVAGKQRTLRPPG